MMSGLIEFLLDSLIAHNYISNRINTLCKASSEIENMYDLCGSYCNNFGYMTEITGRLEYGTDDLFRICD